jgi:hypothetical protein
MADTTLVHSVATAELRDAVIDVLGDLAASTIRDGAVHIDHINDAAADPHVNDLWHDLGASGRVAAVELAWNDMAAISRKTHPAFAQELIDGAARLYESTTEVTPRHPNNNPDLQRYVALVWMARHVEADAISKCTTCTPEPVCEHPPAD